MHLSLYNIVITAHPTDLISLIFDRLYKGYRNRKFSLFYGVSSNLIVLLRNQLRILSRRMEMGLFLNVLHTNGSKNSVPTIPTSKKKRVADVH